MKDFEGKRIRITYNALQGWLSQSGDYLKTDNGFIVFIEDSSKSIKYVNTEYIKTIEILGDCNG